MRGRSWLLLSAIVDVTCGCQEAGLPTSQLLISMPIDASIAIIPHTMKTPPMRRAKLSGTACARACCVGFVARPSTMKVRKRSETLRVTSAPPPMRASMSQMSRKAHVWHGLRGARRDRFACNSAPKSSASFDQALLRNQLLVWTVSYRLKPTRCPRSSLPGRARRNWKTPR